MCLGRYHGTVVVVAIEIWFNQHVLQITVSIIEIIQHILLPT